MPIQSGLEAAKGRIDELTKNNAEAMGLRNKRGGRGPNETTWASRMTVNTPLKIDLLWTGKINTQGIT